MPTLVKQELLVVQVPAEVKNRLRDLMWLERTTVSGLVRTALERFLADHETAK
jgi:hypothetical protein